MIISIWEIIDMLIITLALGYIFSDLFSRYSRVQDEEYDPLTHYRKRFDWSSFWFAAMVTAPAVILHEFGHKFTAMAFGAEATFHAASLFGVPYGGVLLGVVLKMVNAGFIFFVPAFVSHTPVSDIAGSIIAFAGPGVNLALWLISLLIMKTDLNRSIKKRYHPFILISGKINMFLFIFNMIPIPGFDGYWVFRGLIGAFF